jgi:hypothetical protein
MPDARGPAGRSLRELKEAAKRLLPDGTVRDYILTGPDKLDDDPAAATAQLVDLARLILTLRKDPSAEHRLYGM